MRLFRFKSIARTGSFVKKFTVFSMAFVEVRTLTGRWGLFAPKPPTRGMMPLDPHLAKYLEWIFRTNTACRAGGYENLRLLAQESREIPRGKASFPLRDSSPAFPGCKASGLAAFSGRARSKTATSLTIFFKQQRESDDSTRHPYSAEVGSRGFNPLVGCGAKPRMSPFVLHFCKWISQEFLWITPA